MIGFSTFAVNPAMPSATGLISASWIVPLNCFPKSPGFVNSVCHSPSEVFFSESICCFCNSSCLTAASSCACAISFS